MLTNVGAIRLDGIVRDRFPSWDRMPSVLRARLLAVVRWITRMDDIEALLASHAEKRGGAFLDDLFEDLDVSCFVSSRDKARIPAEGRLIVVANHPLGAMDALALLRVLLDVRSDTRVVVNELLMHVRSLDRHFLPFDMFSARLRKSAVAAMGKVLEQEAALLIFPAGDISRLTTAGLRDGSWRRGAAHLASKYHAPVLPVFIGGRNSFVFCVLSFFSRTLALLLLPRQIFRRRGTTIALTIGDAIPANVFAQPVEIALLRKHVYALGSRHSTSRALS